MSLYVIESLSDTSISHIANHDTLVMNLCFNSAHAILDLILLEGQVIEEVVNIRELRFNKSPLRVKFKFEVRKGPCEHINLVL
jgi:hypothetical protein